MVDVPATVPGPVVLLLILVTVGGIGLRMWLADRDLRQFERQERFRRDQQAQDEWERAKRAMAPRSLPWPR